MAHAVWLCPELIMVRPTFPAYGTASQQVMEHLHALTLLIEQISIDEAFLDVSALGVPGDVIATQLQTTTGPSHIIRRGAWLRTPRSSRLSAVYREYSACTAPF